MPTPLTEWVDDVASCFSCSGPGVDDMTVELLRLIGPWEVERGVAL